MRGTVRKKQLAADMEGAAQHRRRLALEAGPSSNPGSEVSYLRCITSIEGELKRAAREKLLVVRMCIVRRQ